MFARGEVVYAGSDAGAAHDRTNQLQLYWRGAAALYAGDLDDDTVRARSMSLHRKLAAR
jgi:hypothetical protein